MRCWAEGCRARPSTLVMGPTGTGKTVMGLQFLAGCTQEAPGLMLGFCETPAQILIRADGVAPRPCLRWCSRASSAFSGRRHPRT